MGSIPLPISNRYAHKDYTIPGSSLARRSSARASRITSLQAWQLRNCILLSLSIIRKPGVVFLSLFFLPNDVARCVFVGAWAVPSPASGILPVLISL